MAKRVAERESDVRQRLDAAYARKEELEDTIQRVIDERDALLGKLEEESEAAADREEN